MLGAFVVAVPPCTSVPSVVNACQHSEFGPLPVLQPIPI